MDYREVLRHIFNERIERNPSYSLRAFSKSMDCANSFISDILNNNKNLSFTKGSEVAEKLKLSADKKKEFLESIQKEKEQLKINESINDESYVEISPDNFAKINHWGYLALLTAIDLGRFAVGENSALLVRFPFSNVEINEMLSQLENFGYIKAVDSIWVSRKAKTRVRGGFPQAAIKKFHSGILKKADESLIQYSYEKRDISSSILSCSEDQLNEAKAEIQKFRRRLARKLSKKTSQAKVYALNISLFPLEVLNNETTT